MEGGPSYWSQLNTWCDSGRAQSCQRRNFPSGPMKRVPPIKLPRRLPELDAFPLSPALSQQKVHKGQIHRVDSLGSRPSLLTTPTVAPPMGRQAHLQSLETVWSINEPPILAGDSYDIGMRPLQGCWEEKFINKQQPLIQTVQRSQSQLTANILITPNMSEVLIRPDFCLNGLILLGGLMTDYDWLIQESA